MDAKVILLYEHESWTQVMSTRLRYINGPGFRFRSRARIIRGGRPEHSRPDQTPISRL